MTKRSDPDTAISTGWPLNPEIRSAFTVAPEVVYSLMSPPFTTNTSDPDTAMPVGLNSPQVVTRVPEVVYSQIMFL